MRFHPKFVVDEKQNKKEVLLPYSEWERIVDEVEELNDIRAYDKAKSDPSDPLLFEDVVKEIQAG